MRFYTEQHRYTCGIDLHVRSLYVCILDDTGPKLVHKKVKASPEALLKMNHYALIQCPFPLKRAVQ